MNDLEIFEAYMKKEHPFIDTVNGAYEAMWSLWQARVPEGYVVVPKEPTCEMVSEGFKEMCVVDMRDFSDESAVNIYKAMLEAQEK